MQLPRVLGLIPARGGSKGITGKNIAVVGGHPLIWYTIRAASLSRKLTDFIVSTDSVEIANVARECGAKVPFMRPAELATDDAKSQDVAIHAVEAYDPYGSFDYLMLLQPTAPLRSPEDIDEAISLAMTFDADSVISFVQLETYHPYYMYFLEADPEDVRRLRVRQVCSYELGLRRQDFPPSVFRNGAIYLARSRHLIKVRSFAADDTVPYIMPASRSVNIDCPEDLDYLDYILARKPPAWLCES